MAWRVLCMQINSLFPSHLGANFHAKALASVSKTSVFYLQGKMCRLWHLIEKYRIQQHEQDSNAQSWH